MLCVAAAAGCKNGPPATESEAGKTEVTRPVILISTTKGDIKVVLFPVFVPYKGELVVDVRENQYMEFIKGIDSGYYSNSAVIPHNKEEPFYEYAIFASPIRDQQQLDAMPRAVQPVRGTLCLMQEENPDGPGIYAVKSRFMIVRKMTRSIHGNPVSLLWGAHFPVGQVIEGLNVLDQLGRGDKILSITRPKDAKGNYEAVAVSAKRLEMLTNGEIDNFADVLKEDAGAATPEKASGDKTGEKPAAPGN